MHAWAALRVFEIDGGTDFDFLERMLHKLLINFTWWVNRKDADGKNVFAGGFLGLDNIGPIDRSAPLPIDGALEQSDGTSWMAMYCLDLLEMSLTLARHDRVYEDVATKFFEHFALIAEAMYSRGLWNEEDGFYYDVLALADGSRIPLKLRSMVGLLPLAATTTLGRDTLDKLPEFTARTDWFMEHRPDYSDLFHMHERDGGEGRLLSIVSPDRLRRVLRWLLDENEFLSPHGVRALSAEYRDRPFSIDLGGTAYTVGYDPGESTTGLREFVGFVGRVVQPHRQREFGRDGQRSLHVEQHIATHARCGAVGRVVEARTAADQLGAGTPGAGADAEAGAAVLARAPWQSISRIGINRLLARELGARVPRRFDERSVQGGTAQARTVHVDHGGKARITGDQVAHLVLEQHQGAAQRASIKCGLQFAVA